MISAQPLSFWPGIVGGLMMFGMVATGRSDDGQLQFGLRSRVQTNDSAKTEFAVVNKKAAWEPKNRAHYLRHVGRSLVPIRVPPGGGTGRPDE